MRPLLAIFLVILFTGCQTFRKPVKGTSAPTVVKQEKKDEKIQEAANQIDVITAPLSVAPEVKEQTDAIRAAVKEAPAADVASLTRSLEARVEKAEKAAQAAQDKSEALLRTILNGICLLGFIAGVSLAFLGSKLPFAGPWQGGSLALGSAAGMALLTARQWALDNKWVMWVLLAASVAFAIANVVWHRATKAIAIGGTDSK